jgi:arylsulfatase A-like enzyme
MPPRRPSRALSGPIALLAACGADPPPPCTYAPEPATGTGGNVVLVVLDDIGVDKIGAYGVHPRPAPTPNIDLLAASGVRFTSAYSQPRCSSARAAMLTGRGSDRTGIGANVGEIDNVSLPLSEMLIPEALTELGTAYSSWAIGKWHLDDVDSVDAAYGPLDQGFAHFDGILGNPRWGVGGFDPDGGYNRWERVVDGHVSMSVDYLLTAQADAAIAAIATLPEPFFLYVALSGAHAPLHIPPADLWRDADPAHELGVGDAMIEATDHELGRIAAALGNRATLILVGDNGTDAVLVRPPALRDHAKGTLYPGGIHVPLIISGPDIAPAVSEALVHVADLFPTVLDLAGHDASDLDVDIDGRSLVPLLDGVSEGRRCVLIEAFEPNRGPSDDNLGFGVHEMSVIEDGFQLVRSRERDELFAVDAHASAEGDDLLRARGPLPPGARTALKSMRRRLRHED